MRQGSPAALDDWGEFGRGWPILLGAILGIAIGVAAVPGPAIGIFMKQLQSEFGWSRAEIALGPTILITVIGLSSPFLGWVADRVNPVWICASGLISLAIGLALFSRLGSDVRLFHAGCAGLALAAAGAGTLPYARVVSSAFVVHRGLALGLATVGTGVTTALLPAFMTPYAAASGWRAGFLALALIVALATPLVLLLMARAPRPHRIPANESPTNARTVFTSGTFWLLVICFGLAPAGIGGLQLHLVSYLSDAGIDPAAAGRTAALMGVFMIIGRIGTGCLLDHFFPPWIAAAAMASSAICIACLSLLGPAAGILGALAIGLANGAELDLIGYFTARYFGLQNYGRVYGVFYTIYVLVVGLSVMIYGRIFDQTGNYSPALWMTAVCLAGSAMAFVVFGRLERRAAASPGTGR